MLTSAPGALVKQPKEEIFFLLKRGVIINWTKVTVYISKTIFLLLDSLTSAPVPPGHWLTRK